MKKFLISVVSILTTLILAVFCCIGCSNSSKNNSSKNNPSDNPNKKPQESEYNIISISEFYNGLARFKTYDGKYGYMDVNGKVVIEPIYTSAQIDFDENVALVSKDGTEMLIDRKGNVIKEFDFDFTAIGTFENGFIWIETKEETISKNIPVMNYYNEKGEKSFSVNNVSHWQSYSSFNEYGYAFVCEDNLYRLIDRYGNIPDFIPQNLYIVNAYGNYITLGIDGNYISGPMYYIDYQNQKLISAQDISISLTSIIELKNSDANGNKIYSCTSKYSTPNADSLISDKCNMLALITKNEILIKLQDIFTDAAYFKAIECGVYNNKTYYTIYMKNQNGVAFYSVIDENGQVLISPTKKYELGYSYSEKVNSYLSLTLTRYQAYAFSSGLCKAKDSETGLFGFIDLQGNWVIQPLYDSVTDFSEHNGSAYAIVNGTTIINNKGEIVFSAQQTNS